MCIILFNLYKSYKVNQIDIILRKTTTTRDLEKLHYLPQTYADGKIDLEFSQRHSDTDANKPTILPVLAMVLVGTWDLVAVLWVTILFSYCQLVTFEVLYSSSVRFLPLFHLWLFSSHFSYHSQIGNRGRDSCPFSACTTNPGSVRTGEEPAEGEESVFLSVHFSPALMTRLDEADSRIPASHNYKLGRR